MAHSVSPAGSGQIQFNDEVNQAENFSKEPAKSWWDTIMGFIFAEEQPDLSQALEDRSIMEIDPSELKRTKRAGQQVQGKGLRERVSNTAHQRLERLASRLALVNQRLALLEKGEAQMQGQIKGFEAENKRAAEELKHLKGVRQRKQRGELTQKVKRLEGEIKRLATQIEKSKQESASLHNEQSLIEAAREKTDSVIKAAARKSTMDDELRRLEKVAELAEIALTLA